MLNAPLCTSPLPLQAANEVTAEVRERAVEAGEAAKQRAGELTEQGRSHHAMRCMGGMGGTVMQQAPFWHMHRVAPTGPGG